MLTAGELADALPAAAVQEPAVVITFDDGFAQAVGEARGRLKEAGMHATFFCVAGHLGATSEWPGRRPDTPVRPLASVEELAALARDGHEIGSHGWSHAALDGETDLRREILESKAALSTVAGCEVRTYAYPYGARPSTSAHALVRQTYAAAFGTRAGRAGTGSPRYELPRVDAHYLRDPRLLRRVVGGSLDAYLVARRFGSRARRAYRKDYVAAA